MNLRHSAALALVGWYLMIPPFSKKDQYGMHADPTAPLSKWQFYNEVRDLSHDQAHALKFKTYEECERKRKEFYDGWFGTNGHLGLKDEVMWTAQVIGKRTEVITYEKCIASDDPRLKETK